jgi:hypothetical protein
MTVPQPFQYQGSKRALAPLILQYLPISTTRLAERRSEVPPPVRVAQPSPGRTSAWAEPRLGPNLGLDRTGGADCGMTGGWIVKFLL